MTSADSLTILKTEGGLATKQIRPEPKTGKLIVTPYGRARYFSVREQSIADLTSLSGALSKLTRAPLCFVIRGAALPGIDHARCRRLRYPDPETGEAATFTDAARQWFAVDLDKLARPVTIDPLAEPADAIEYLIGLLPPELHDASCWWQWTSSQSLRGNTETLSARLWFWSIDPVSDAELTHWSRRANQRAGFRLIDPCLYRAVQPHYIAAPIFAGMRDPLPLRHGVRQGLDDGVTLVIPEPDRSNHYAGSGSYAIGRGVSAYLEEVGGDRGLRAPILSAVASYFAINGADADRQTIKELIRAAIDTAPSGCRSDADIERYRSDRHLDEMLQWCARQEAARHPRRSRIGIVSMPDELERAQ